MTYYIERHDSPIGTLNLVATDKALHCVVFEGKWAHLKNQYKGHFKSNHLLLETKRQIDEYFAAKRRSFELPLVLKGSPFQCRIWNALNQIPFGETITYKEHASLIDSPKAFRAVGSANGRNPLCLILPCHRVVGIGGKITGYAGGLEAKKFLILFEHQQSVNISS